MGVTLIHRLADALAPHVHRLAWANLAANIAIIVTGGAVRLTGSGLGCPTWPRCTEEAFTPHGALDLHSAIEFGNRLLTFVLTAVAIAAFLAALGHSRRHSRPDLVRLAVIIGLGIPAQAVLGGITVLTQLNPWIVGAHLLVSLAIVSVCTLFLDRLRRGSRREPRPGRRGVLAWTTYGVAWLVFAIGTVVTGSGPHAGDAATPRNGLDPLELSQLHADAVFLLLGLTIAAVILFRSHAARLLLWVILAQGLVGFVQYFTDLPILLVGIHLLGTGVAAAAVTWFLLDTLRADHPSSDAAGEDPDRRTTSVGA